MSDGRARRYRAEPLRAPDYDELTSDIPESDETVTNFSGAPTDTASERCSSAATAA